MHARQPSSILARPSSIEIEKGYAVSGYPESQQNPYGNGMDHTNSRGDYRLVFGLNFCFYKVK